MCPWDQLLKVGIEELHDRCSVVLGESSGLPEVPVVGEYRSTVCEQLGTLEASTVVDKSPVKKSTDRKCSVKVAGGRGPRTQTSLDISGRDAEQALSKRKQPVRTTQSKRNTGRRTGGVSSKSKRFARPSFIAECVTGSSKEGGRR